MSDWIELNLPYNKHEYTDYSEIIYPDLDKRAKRELGFTSKDCTKLYDLLPSYDSLGFRKAQKLMDKINANLDLLFSNRGAEWQQERIKKFVKSKNADVQLTGQWLEKHHRYQQWGKIQPDVIAYNHAIRIKTDAHKEKLKKESFAGMGLDKPGTLIEVVVGDKVSQYLIGHINPSGVCCDDCTEFNSANAIVLRYKIVWIQDESSK